MPQFRLDEYLAQRDAIPFTQDAEDILMEDGDIYVEEDREETPELVEELTLDPQSNLPRESMYVRMFGEVIDTVLDGEQYLFTEAELKLIEQYKALPYASRYLLIRLILRKPGKWHRSDILKKSYHADIPNLKAAMNELCQCSGIPQATQSFVKSGGREYIVIDDSDDEEPPPAPVKAVEYFLEDDAQASLKEMLGCLRMPELKLLAKDMKVKSVDVKRAEIIDALIGHAEKQGTLNFFTKTQTQVSRVRALVKKVTGRCVRVNSDIHQLFRRINIVFFRSTQLTATLLPLILTNTRANNPSHRTYPLYVPTRTTSIFPSRSVLLTYENALEIENRVCNAMANEGRVEGAAQALDLFRPAFARWKELLEELEEGESESAAPRAGPLERFHEGHVLTRVVYKGAFACGVLKRHHEEEQILKSLLSQTRWRKGRRGAWYDRLALILTNYKDKDSGCDQEALDILKEGLEDPGTHLIHRPALEKRLFRLEKKLNVPSEDRYKSCTRLKPPPSKLITGRRIIPLPERAFTGRGESIANVLLGNGARQSPKPGAKDGRAQSVPKPTTSAAKGKAKQDIWGRSTGKSVWKGKEAEVSVEEFALEHYETLGYKGFHSEGRIILHMFALLFWSVLFDSTVPGAFETPFQSCPLDLVHDSFFPSREKFIEARLDEIEMGQGLDLIREVDERERPLKTWAIGVRWDDFSLEDVLGIAEGLGGPALSMICRLLAEEYSCRGSGVPDLVVWNEAEKKTMFVEVKGPGDQLRENQRVWIDVMLRHNIAVEVCRVEEEGYQPRQKKAATSTCKSVGPKRKAEAESDNEEDEENFDAMDVEVVRAKSTPSRSQPPRKRPFAEVVQ